MQECTATCMSVRSCVAATIVLLTGLAGCADPPDTPPSLFEVSLEEWGKFEAPIWVGDSPQGIVVGEQAGSLRLQDGTVILDLHDLVGSGGERGLLGVAFVGDDILVHHSDLQGNTVVAVYEPARRELFHLEQPYSNHNGGALLVGPDDRIYLGLGDGGDGGDPHGNGQNPATQLGSILRFDWDGELIPAADNPYDNGVWLYGVRNPWRFHFDAEGGLWVADVGQGKTEEDTYLPAGEASGANLGWNAFEGSQEFAKAVPDTVFPIIEYDHRGGRCSITGGVVVREGALAGQYLYGDWCSGTLWSYHDGASTVLLETDLRIVHIAETADGILIADHRGGVMRLTELALTA